MKLNFNKRDSVIPDTNLGPPKRRWRFIPALAVGVTLLVGGVLPTTGWAATIEGSKFVDNNNSGVKDANEGVAGDTIYMKPASAPSFFRARRDVTDENGDFGFYGLPTGDYKVWEASNQPSGVQTLSSSEQDAKIITIDDSEQTVSLDFELNPYPVVKIVSSVESPVEINAGDSFTFDISVQDADSETVNLHWYIWDGGQNYQYGDTEVGIPYSQQITHEVSSDHSGMLYVYVYARDEQHHWGYDYIFLSSLAVKITSPSEPVEIVAGETLNFTASIEDLIDEPSGNYYLYWDFGTRGWNSWSNSEVQAGTSEVIAPYLYEAGGRFPVRVYVWDNQGRGFMDTINVEVEGEPNTLPQVGVYLQSDEQETPVRRNARSGVEIEVDSPSSLTAGSPVNFTVSIDDPDTTNTYRISVSFGDGGRQQIETTSPSEREIDISYTYSGGDFTVWVYVEDSAGGYVNGTLAISVAGDPNSDPEIQLVSPSTPIEVKSGDAITFDVSISDPESFNDPLRTRWNYGDGTWDMNGNYQETENPSTVSIPHTYTTGGTYQFTVSASDNKGGYVQQVFEVGVDNNMVDWNATSSDYTDAETAANTICDFPDNPPYVKTGEITESDWNGKVVLIPYGISVTLDADVNATAICNKGEIIVTTNDIEIFATNLIANYPGAEIRGTMGIDSTELYTAASAADKENPAIYQTGTYGTGFTLVAGTNCEGNNGLIFNDGTILAGEGGNGYASGGNGGNLTIEGCHIVQAGSIWAGNGGNGNAELVRADTVIN